MPTISTLLRWFGATCLVCLVALGLVVWLMPQSTAKPRVVGAHCDDRGGVDSIMLDAPHAGRLTFSWDNRAACGEDNS